jgi:hypothetical protein
MTFGQSPPPQMFSNRGPSGGGTIGRLWMGAGRSFKLINGDSSCSMGKKEKSPRGSLERSPCVTSYFAILVSCKATFSDMTKRHMPRKHPLLSLPAKHSNSDTTFRAKNYFFSCQSCSLLLHHIFSFNWHYRRTTYDLHFIYELERRAQGNSLLLSALSIFVLPWLTFTFCIIAPSFLSRSNGLATDIGSLEPGLDAHVPRLGIGTDFLDTTSDTFCAAGQLFPLLQSLGHSARLVIQSPFTPI